MAEPYVGEIRLTAFNFAPQGWAPCDGRALPISEFQALFALIGTTYGGDGVNTFNLPDLRGRVPAHQGNNFIIGQLNGTETVTLTTNQLPMHNHPLLATTNTAASTNLTGNVQATSVSQPGYITPTAPTSMAGHSTVTGQSLPHENMQPYLVANFIVALYGVFPSQG